MHLVLPFLQKFEDLFDFAFTSAALNMFNYAAHKPFNIHASKFICFNSKFS